MCRRRKEGNAAVQVENSVFMKRNRTNVERLDKVMPSKEDFGEDGECGLLISKTSTTFTMTSRSNVPVGVDGKEKGGDGDDGKDKKNRPQLTSLTSL